MNKDKIIETNEKDVNVVNSRDFANVENSGNCAKVKNSGDYAKVENSGNCAKVKNSGDYTNVVNSGYDANVVNSGNCANVVNSGDYAKVENSGNSVSVENSGNCAKVKNSGDYTKVVNSGDDAKVENSGNSVRVANSGNCAKVENSGNSVSVANSGNYAKHNIKGTDSVCFDCGLSGFIKGVKGTYIALCEWYKNNDKWHIRGTATAQIDGKKLKENTYYGLYNGKFTEIDFTDGETSAVIKNKGKVKLVKLIDTENNIITDKVSYIVTDNNGNFAHGETIKKAKESLIYKISNRDTSKYKDYTLDTIVTLAEAINIYRVITGACEFGTKNFVEKYKIKNKKYTIKEIIEITKGQFGNEDFTKFFEEKKNDNKSWSNNK